MKNLIIFTTKYGSVEKCAKILAKELDGETEIVNLKTDSIPKLDSFEKIILGGSIYIGKTQSAISKFAEENIEVLSSKKVGIFVNSGDPTVKKYVQVKSSFPAKVHDKAVAIGLFGDEITWEKCSFMDKLALRLIKKVKASYSNIDEKEISRFAKLMNEA